MGNPNIKNYGFGARPREVDDEYRSRIKGVPRKRVWTKDYCIEQLEDLLGLLKKVLKDSDKLNKSDPKKLKDETIRDAITLMNKILDVMNYLYPKPQENINLNIDVTMEDLIKKWQQKKSVVVVNNQEEEEDDDEES